MSKRVGVIGGGQLAWMMAGAAEKLGIELVVQTPKSDDPAVAIASHTILAAIDDASATAQLAQQCDVITFENEFIDLAALAPLEAQGVRFYPRLQALAPLLDKYHQRSYLREIGLPMPDFTVIDPPFDAAVLELVLERFGFPVVLKARRHGYDGQGTFILKSNADLEALLQKADPQSWLLEAFVPFERELAVMAARSPQGEIIVYPVVETQQENQVCRRVFVLSDLDPRLATEVGAIARTLLDRLQVVGIFGIELFLTATGKVLINEIAPRTHNSGHYTLDACETSQFEQQLRAVTGLPLGSSTLRCAGAVMVNLLGFEHSHSDYAEQRHQLAQLPQAYVHWYGKTESRPGRKLGHVTILLDETEPIAQRSQAEAIAQQVESIWQP